MRTHFLRKGVAVPVSFWGTTPFQGVSFLIQGKAVCVKLDTWSASDATLMSSFRQAACTGHVYTYDSSDVTPMRCTTKLPWGYNLQVPEEVKYLFGFFFDVFLHFFLLLPHSRSFLQLCSSFLSCLSSGFCHSPSPLLQPKPNTREFSVFTRKQVNEAEIKWAEFPIRILWYLFKKLVKNISTGSTKWRSTIIKLQYSWANYRCVVYTSIKACNGKKKLKDDKLSTKKLGLANGIH